MKDVTCPIPNFEFTSKRVLVREWIDGTKLTNNSPQEANRLVNIGIKCYLMQLLETGFFHADPHPGNLLRTQDGKLCFLDFGLVTEITQK